jgi:uncharacterized membrane protein SpoIIM required for sporulation
VNIDSFLAEHDEDWKRLADLTRRGRKARSLSPTELDDLVSLYQRTSTHLSVARTTFNDPALTARLTRLVGDANAVIYGTRPHTLRALRRFFTVSFPAAVWHDRWFVVVAAALTFVPALAVGGWLAHSSAAVEATAPAAVREAYVNDDFESYYSSKPAAEFASEVFVNNVQVAIYAFAAGILLCAVTAYILIVNGSNVGVAAGLFAAAGQSPKFWGLILPHGLLELSAVVIAGAAGLRLGWAIIDPGDQSRRDALAEQGRRSVVIILGLIVAFAVAGTIEGFVTGSGLPTFFRVGLGVVVAGAFWLSIITQGRIAAARGFTGLLSEEDAAIRAKRIEPAPALVTS